MSKPKRPEGTRLNTENIVKRKYSVGEFSVVRTEVHMHAEREHDKRVGMDCAARLDCGLSEL